MRKTEKKAATSLDNQSEKKRILEALNKSKYSLLKNEHSLNEKQKEKLKSVQDVSPKLAKMHVLKEEFRDIFKKISKHNRRYPHDDYEIDEDAIERSIESYEKRKDLVIRGLYVPESKEDILMPSVGAVNPLKEKTPALGRG
jgi:transposase